MSTFFPRAFGALSIYAAELEAGHLDDWCTATGPIEGTFAEERDPALTVLEREAQAEHARREGKALADMLVSAVCDHRDAPRSPEMAAAWGLAWLAAQLADNYPDTAKMLVARADGGRP
jgi:hypothetical protein